MKINNDEKVNQITRLYINVTLYFSKIIHFIINSGGVLWLEGFVLCPEKRKCLVLENIFSHYVDSQSVCLFCVMEKTFSLFCVQKVKNGLFLFIVLPNYTDRASLTTFPLNYLG